MLEQPSQHAQNAASEDLTSSLLQSVQVVMQRAEAEGREASDEELREIVSRAVLDGVVTGFGMSTEGAPGRAERDGDDVKRPRTEGLELMHSHRATADIPETDSSSSRWWFSYNRLRPE
ncbi:hypothetical protein TRAPUB_8230 [Trametes pubescens]|uniref:Uncharacterized protein n=1 Tax=Trametes pubescens TaxID=154538 RepID=A0A1M2W5S1_TRAPU|nr:hypothetical protein TRAPUB_8230 [Trametes pubescens]